MQSCRCLAKSQARSFSTSTAVAACTQSSGCYATRPGRWRSGVAARLGEETSPRTTKLYGGRNQEVCLNEGARLILERYSHVKSLNTSEAPCASDGFKVSRTLNPGAIANDDCLKSKPAIVGTALVVSLYRRIHNKRCRKASSQMTFEFGTLTACRRSAEESAPATVAGTRNVSPRIDR